jgi:hypothetical protein
MVSEPSTKLHAVLPGNCRGEAVLAGHHTCSRWAEADHVAWGHCVWLLSDCGSVQVPVLPLGCAHPVCLLPVAAGCGTNLVWCRHAQPCVACIHMGVEQLQWSCPVVVWVLSSWPCQGQPMHSSVLVCSPEPDPQRCACMCGQGLCASGWHMLLSPITCSSSCHHTSMFGVPLQHQLPPAYLQHQPAPSSRPLRL